MSVVNLEFIGYFAGFLTSVSQLPQVIRVIKTRETKSISLWTYLILFTGIVLWLIYGILTEDLPLIIANSITVISTLTIIRYKIKFG
jgi:MtN3 and saliva related transmembrane protein